MSLKDGSKNIGHLIALYTGRIAFIAVISWIIATFNLIVGVSTLEVLVVLVIGNAMLGVADFVARLTVTRIYDSTSMSKNTAEYLFMLTGGDPSDVEPKETLNPSTEDSKDIMDGEKSDE